MNASPQIDFYLLAGSDIAQRAQFACRLTEKAFKLGHRVHIHTDDEAAATELDALAVRLALEVRAEAHRPGALIAGSIAPLEDCYLPVFETPAAEALAEHRAQAHSLAEAGVDFLTIETMPTAAEAALALQAALETGAPTTIGFVCAPLEAGQPVRLLSGETLAEAVALVQPLGPAAIFVNCAAPPVITAALRELRDLTSLPTGGYANVGRTDDEVGWAPDDELSGDRYAEHAREWLTLGARVIGGCCGTHPGHTAALRRLLDDPHGGWS